MSNAAATNSTGCWDHRGAGASPPVKVGRCLATPSPGGDVWMSWRIWEEQSWTFIAARDVLSSGGIAADQAWLHIVETRVEEEKVIGVCVCVCVIVALYCDVGRGFGSPSRWQATGPECPTVLHETVRNFRPHSCRRSASVAPVSLRRERVCSRTLERWVHVGPKTDRSTGADGIL